MIEEQLKDYKKIYKELSLPDSVIEQKWAARSELFPQQEVVKPVNRFFPYTVFAGAFVVLLFIIGGFVFTAKPGSLLYSVNSFAQQLTKKVGSTLQKGSHTFTPPKIHTETTPLKYIPTPSTRPTMTTAPQPSKKQELQSAGQNTNNYSSDNQTLGTQTEKSVSQPTSFPTQAEIYENSDNSSHSNNSNNSHNENNTNAGNANPGNSQGNSDHGKGKK